MAIGCTKLTFISWQMRCKEILVPAVTQTTLLTHLSHSNEGQGAVRQTKMTEACSSLVILRKVFKQVHNCAVLLVKNIPHYKTQDPSL